MLRRDEGDAPGHDHHVPSDPRPPSFTRGLAFGTLFALVLWAVLLLVGVVAASFVLDLF